MVLRETTRAPIASTIEAAFSHADQFDFINLRLAFDGLAFSSSPITSDWYDGPWDDRPCEHADFLVYFSSVFCAFDDLVKFLEAIALGVEQCSFHWDAEGPGGSFAWQQASQGGAGFLSVTWLSKPSFRYVVRIDGKSAVRCLYGAFREFVESDSYDPVRYERMPIGEIISLVLAEDDLDRLPAELAKLDAAAEALLGIVDGGPGERTLLGPKQRYALNDCLGHVEGDLARRKELGDTILQWKWITAEWDNWPIERRLEDIEAIMGWESGSWHGANLRAMKSDILEAWLRTDESA
jgi:hypothetical protein